ncbi:hypothetical protein QF042_003794 [Pedobacter sp. W3I1]|uniref:hypothetical protein n=1 Tax=Pedobacter sp. W3I1 TaxID=3042291 RepID=UPI002783754C|nr:hypothetical protein [Pedobacter sp. W3I1]MDQ0640229.1 hypothetical protein [Pedobacter sp. W3I1]
MIRINSFIYLFIICIACSCGRSKDNKPTGETHVSFTGKKSKYKFDFYRNINYNLKQLQQVDFDLGQLIEIKAFGDQLVGLDYKASKLFFFNSKLDTAFTFGTAGDGPNENNGIMSYEYADKKLTLYDFGHRSLKKYQFNSNNKDSLLYNYRFVNGTLIYRAIHLSENTYMYTNPLDKVSDLLFQVIDSTENKSLFKQSIYGLIGLKNPIKFPEMALDGNFLSNPNSKFIVYSCSYAGTFLSFQRSDPKKISFNKTIDKTPVPIAAYKTIAPGTSHLEISPSTTFFPSSALSKNNLYLLNKITDDNSYVVDYYDLAQSGKYQGSFYIPKLDDGQEATSIAVIGQSIYVLYEDLALVKYSMIKV